MSAIKSLLDDDLYKFTMQQAVLKHYSNAVVEHRFKNRGKQRFSELFLKEFEKEINALCELRLTNDEAKYLRTLSFLQPWYVDFLSSYRYDPSELKYCIDNDGNFELTIHGPWYRTILWEVKLMSIISEVYFRTDDTNWDMKDQGQKLQKKTSKLMSVKCKYADFGTRRRRSFEVQDFIVQEMRNHYWFLGTSNIYLAMKYGVKPIGTMAHEWVQGVSALESMNHPNKFMLQRWQEVYGSELNVALSDTFGSTAFLKDFDKNLAQAFDTRHDSGDPFKYTDKMVQHYKSLGIDPRNKNIVFSDALTADLAADIQSYCDKVGIGALFGIGTFFTNDFNTQALNMVIKLWTVNGTPVVKLSDNPGKSTGDEIMVEFMRYLHG